MQETSGMPSNFAAHAAATLGASAARDAIWKGEMSAESYATALLRRAREQAQLRAFITIEEDSVLASARAADRARAAGAHAPLLGVPMGIKDSYLTRGLRTTLGVSNLMEYVPNRDAESVELIRSAGGIVFGKNNLVEMSYGLTGHNGAYGQVHNPRAAHHVTGGSSSGSAAAVAAGIVPAALGGDTIGSIRVPASLCGIVGFKPTTGRWPRGGVAPISHTLDTTGVFARNVEDCMLIDQVITGEADPTGEPPAGLKGVRLAYAPRQYLELVAPEVEARFHDTVRGLREAGAEIVEVDLGHDFSALALNATWNIFFRETRGAITDFLRHHDIPVTFDQIYGALKSELKEVWARFALPDGPGYISVSSYDAVLRERDEIRHRFDEAFLRSGAQALVFPTTPCTAPSTENQTSFTIAGHPVNHLALANHTIPTSAAGLPGVSIPVGSDQHHLPIGLEIDGPYGKDRSLLQLARRIEAVVGTLSLPV